MLPKNNSLFETILVSINDKFVELFLSNRLNLLIFQKMNKMLSLYSLKNIKRLNQKILKKL